MNSFWNSFISAIQPNGGKLMLKFQTHGSPR